MKLAKIIAWIGLLAMSVVLAYGFTVGNFVEDGKAILANPWGIVSLVDLYVGFVLFSLALGSLETVEKVDRVSVDVIVGYDAVDALKRIFPEHEVELREEEYGADVRFRCAVPEPSLDTFLQAVRDVSRGGARTERPEG